MEIYVYKHIIVCGKENRYCYLYTNKNFSALYTILIHITYSYSILTMYKDFHLSTFPLYL